MFTRMRQFAAKATAPALRFHVLTKGICAAAVACGANTDFGAAIRLSEDYPKALRALPTQEQAKTQYYMDLYADGIRLLEHLIEKLGNEPAREEQAVWRTFSQKLFSNRKPSARARPLEFAAYIVYAPAWELAQADSPAGCLPLSATRLKAVACAVP